MPNFKKGDEIITKLQLWHHGENVGDRLGRIIDTTGHIIVELYDYHDNPIKCFRNEIESLNNKSSKDLKKLDELDNVFDDWVD